MPVTANEQTVDTISTTNVKNVGELHALTAGLSGQNQLANQQRMTDAMSAAAINAVNAGQQMAQLAAQQALTLSAAIQARTARFLLDTSAEEAVAFTKQVGSDIQDKLTNIEAALSGSQAFEKTAITTPPQTGTGGAFGSDAGNALLQQIVNAQAVMANAIAQLQAQIQSKS